MGVFRMLIIDGTYLIYKSYYRTKKLEKSISIENETHFKRIVRNNFLKILASVKNKFQTKFLFIAFDSDGKNFRNDLLPSYKAHRKEKPPELEGIKLEIYQFLKSNHFCFQIAENVEADDLIASYIESNPNERISVYTGDGDLAALVNQNVRLLLDKGKKIQEITIQNFHHFFAVPPSLFADYKALQGDKSDNVKGVDGLFRTEAIHLLLEYHTIANYFTSGEDHYLYSKLLQFRDKVLINQKVTSLKKDCSLTFKKEQAKIESITIPRNLERKIGW
ncbi:hypothetical protein CN918_25200 [Priestia megaterium]|nr:hypothetical protein CN918_25200 [Priestia megaterium]